MQVLFNQMCVHNGAFTSLANISFWCTYVCFLVKVSNLEILGFLCTHKTWMLLGSPTVFFGRAGILEFGKVNLLQDYVPIDSYLIDHTQL